MRKFSCGLKFRKFRKKLQKIFTAKILQKYYCSKFTNFTELPNHIKKTGPVPQRNIAHTYWCHMVNVKETKLKTNKLSGKKTRQMEKTIEGKVRRKIFETKW